MLRINKVTRINEENVKKVWFYIIIPIYMHAYYIPLFVWPNNARYKMSNLMWMVDNDWSAGMSRN